MKLKNSSLNFCPKWRKNYSEFTEGKGTNVFKLAYYRAVHIFFEMYKIKNKQVFSDLLKNKSFFLQTAHKSWQAN